MRRIHYSVAASLDGYIAGPNGEFDWIMMDREVDFEAIYAQFDAVLMGRRTYEAALAQSRGGAVMPGMQTFVFSRTLRGQDHPGVTLVSEDARETIAALKAAPGKDVWLFGGAMLFRSLLELGLVDRVEVAVMPVLLGGGLPLLSVPSRRASLELAEHKVYPTGIVGLKYNVKPGLAHQARRPSCLSAALRMRARDATLHGSAL